MACPLATLCPAHAGEAVRCCLLQSDAANSVAAEGKKCQSKEARYRAFQANIALSLCCTSRALGHEEAHRPAPGQHLVLSRLTPHQCSRGIQGRMMRTSAARLETGATHLLCRAMSMLSTAHACCTTQADRQDMPASTWP